MLLPGKGEKRDVIWGERGNGLNNRKADRLCKSREQSDWSRQRGQGSVLVNTKRSATGQTTRCLASPTSRSVWKCRSVYVCTLAHTFTTYLIWTSYNNTVRTRDFTKQDYCARLHLHWHGTKFSCRAQTDLCSEDCLAPFRPCCLFQLLKKGCDCGKVWQEDVTQVQIIFPLFCYGDMLLNVVMNEFRGCQKDISVCFCSVWFIHLWMCTTVQTFEVSNIILAFNIFRKYAFNWSKVTIKTLT